jgi:hypothetical protein
MTLRNARPLRFSPAGLSDAIAEEDAFPGACSSLQNLIPLPSTKNVWTPRPASILFNNLSSFTAPTGVPVFKVVGGFLIGLVSDSAFPGFDRPFMVNLVTGAFVAITGPSSSNLPATQPTSGDWTPPTMDVMGTIVVFTHPGFDGVTNFFGSLNISNLAAPVWSAGNFTLVSPLVAVTVAFPGSGYTNGTYNNIPLQGGTGSGATANITVAGGVVSAVTIVNGGVGYNIGDALSVNNTLIGGGTGSVFLASSVTGSGIAFAAIINTGMGYTSGYYIGVALDGGTGTGATANIVVVNGSVVSVDIATGGSGNGYLVNDIVASGGVITALGSITRGSGYTNGTYSNIPLIGGTGAQATANITVAGGDVTVVTLVDHGIEYTASDTLTVPTGGAIIGIYISNPGAGPSGYNAILTNQSQIGTSGVGRRALFTVTVTNGMATNIILTSPGYDYVVGEVLQFPYGSTYTVLSVTATGPLGPGTGFSIPVSTVTTSALGSGGTGFLAEVVTLTNPGGYINFTTTPSWVRQFNGRSWFGINPASGIPSVIFTDVYALNCTNANQALSFGDNTPLTAAAPLGLANLLGGVVQSLIIFKSLNGIIQITGDATTNDLTVNQVPGGSGTISPRSLTEHPQGLLYLDHDGYRMVTLDGNCTDPIGVAGQGVVVPFLNPTNPSRVNAACNGSVLRVSVLNSNNSTWEEYWFDSTRKIWHGPHTFPSTMIDVYQDNFVIASEAAPVGIWIGQAFPTLSSTFTENSVALSWTYQTTVLNDNQEMAQSEIAEMQIKTNNPDGLTSITVSAIEEGATLNSEVYTYPLTPILPLAAWPIDFNSPVVYNRLTIEITGASVGGFEIGDLYIRARVLGYRSARF